MSDRARARDLLQHALAALDLAAELGIGEARHAAAVLRGRRPEHEGIDDSEALAEIARLEARGRARAAIGIVANKLAATPEARAALERRLRRKRSKKSGQHGLPVSKTEI